ncbi:hypothetical protein JHK85_000745 [Glycine max]|uniref:Putative AC transposase n=1 Tax=Glycine soja TaxID=3848 RepID=A0A0B2Q246_GLYSO|nr:hypothetical protein JHK87_000733 [Glycine soja]KAG5068368.1 hypothetical protein JHK85_000745 [Glycine max]KAG5088113.1 hypothetical protein JHK86_000725 [Glycine max]KHN15651.1 Putative AC transposase [Glycine soja]
MTVTTYFIDDSMTLQSQLVRFIYVSAPHTSIALVEVLVQCLMDWDLDWKLSTLTVDNYSTNDAMIECIIERKFCLGLLFWVVNSFTCVLVLIY